MTKPQWCLCAPTHREYSDGVRLILNQNLPKSLTNIVAEYAQMETPLHEIAKMYIVKPSDLISAANVRTSAIYFSPALQPNGSLTALIFTCSNERDMSITIHVRTQDIKTISAGLDQINNIMKSCGYRVYINDWIMSVSMPHECTCGKW